MSNVTSGAVGDYPTHEKRYTDTDLISHIACRRREPVFNTGNTAVTPSHFQSLQGVTVGLMNHTCQTRTNVILS